MCGRYGLKEYPSRLIRRLGSEPRTGRAFQPRYNIAPTDSLLSIINDDARSIVELRWGLVPPFASDPEQVRLSTFNARIETIATAPTYRDALRRQRCAVFGSGYFEWRKNTDGSKTPLWIHRKDGEPFAFAGLWSTWRRGDAELRSCTIVTQPPNELLSTIHSRMPVILGENAADGWLSAGPRDAADMIALLEPQRSQDWVAHPVSLRIGNVRNDDSTLIEPVDDGLMSLPF